MGKITAEMLDSDGVITINCLCM